MLKTAFIREFLMLSRIVRVFARVIGVVMAMSLGEPKVLAAPIT